MSSNSLKSILKSQQSSSQQSSAKINKGNEKLKVVNLWTKVIINNQQPLHIKPTKLEYKSNSCINKGRLPKIVHQLIGGMIMELPTEDIEDTIKDLIEFENLPKDSELIHFLE
jgi:hypothetical protein